MVLSIMTIGATYAYWAASTQSASRDVQTESTIYSISMSINPLYHDFSVIPMNDSDAVKALRNKCKDKYDRGACTAYVVNVYDYNEDLEYISGFMDITTNNMQNLSYMMFRVSDTYDEEKCVNIEVFNENYCIVKEAAVVGDGVGLSLGDAYKVLELLIQSLFYYCGLVIFNIVKMILMLDLLMLLLQCKLVMVVK